MISDFIITQTAPIVENRIKEVIQGVAKRNNINALDIRIMLRMENEQIAIYAFKDRKKIERIPFAEIKGNIGNVVENRIKEIFRGTAFKSETQIALVNFILRLQKNGVITVLPYVNNVYGNLMTIKELIK